MIDYINNFAAAIANMLKLMGIQNSIFMLVVFLVLISAKNIPARFRYVIAFVGLLKSVMPVFVPAPFLQKTIVNNFTAQVETAVALDMQPVVIEPVFTSAGIILLIWFVFFLGFFMQPILQALYWRIKLGKAEYIFDFSWIGRSIPVYKSVYHSVPFTLGVLNPKIYIPQNWQDWPQASRNFALKHEMAHISRHDNFARFIQHTICSLLFFHPFVWVLSKKLNEYREMACDDFATDGQKHISLEYARALVNIAEDLMPAAIPSASASALIKQKHELYNRINYQMENAMKSKNTKRSVWLVAMMLLLIVPLSWTEPAPKQQDAPPPPPKTEKEVHVVYDTPPAVVGGFAEIQRNLVYPELARKNDVQGKVIVTFVVDAKGNTRDFGVKNFLGSGCDEAAVQAIKSVKWTPAEKDGKSVSAQISMPVSFNLAGAKKETSSEESPIFSAYDQAPEAIGGYAAIQQNLRYPEIARKAGVEGKVILLAVIDEQGDVVKTAVVKSLGNNGCDEAAVAAIKKTKWKPALKDDKPIQVQISIPVVFKLANEDKEKQ